MRQTRRPARQISLTDLVRGPGRMLVNADAAGLPMHISPKEALGQLIHLEPGVRKFFGQLIVKNWAEQVAAEEVSAETLHALRAVIATRTFDPERLSLSPRDPFALLEYYPESIHDGRDTDHVQVVPSLRGLALVEALLTSDEVTY